MAVSFGDITTIYVNFSMIRGVEGDKRSKDMKLLVFQPTWSATLDNEDIPSNNILPSEPQEMMIATKIRVDPCNSACRR